MTPVSAMNWILECYKFTWIRFDDRIKIRFDNSRFDNSIIKSNCEAIKFLFSWTNRFLYFLFKLGLVDPRHLLTWVWSTLSKRFHSFWIIQYSFGWVGSKSTGCYVLLFFDSQNICPERDGVGTGEGRRERFRHGSASNVGHGISNTCSGSVVIWPCNREC